MRDDQLAELEKLHELMTDDLIKIGFAAVEAGFETQEDRGNKVWLYKGFNQCGSGVAKIDQVIGMRKGIIPPTSTNTETQERYEQDLIRKAKAAVAAAKEQANRPS